MSVEYIELKKHMDEFERIVRKLSKGVNQKDAGWDDPQLAQLRQSISKVAKESGRILRAGTDCENTLKRFYSIVSEI